jgi:hypothetical protein
VSIAIQKVTPPITTTGANEIVPLKIPHNGWLLHLVITGDDGSVDFWTRKFTWDDPVDIARIRNGPGGYGGAAQIESKNLLPLHVGDLVTISGTALHDGTSRVIEIISDTVVQLNAGYSSDETDAGTITLDIPDEEKELYRALDAVTVSSGLGTFTSGQGRFVLNSDPLPPSKNIRDRVLYLQFASAGTYRVSMTFLLVRN